MSERWDLIPAFALERVAQAMGEGCVKYGADNWRGLPQENILNHAIRHLFLYLKGDRTEDHLSHAACNCLMAAELEGVGEHDEQSSQ